MKLDRKLEAALEATGLPWGVERGSRHFKIRLAGRLVGVYPHGKAQTSEKRSLLNTIAQVRRAAQEIRSS